jgi:hypothetical protein
MHTLSHQQRASNPHEARNRTLKALAIADLVECAYPVAVEDGVTNARSIVSWAAAMPAEHCRLIAGFAGQKEPSEATWIEVVSILYHRAEQRAAVGGGRGEPVVMRTTMQGPVPSVLATAAPEFRA